MQSIAVHFTQFLLMNRKLQKKALHKFFKLNNDRNNVGKCPSNIKTKT